MRGLIESAAGGRWRSFQHFRRQRSGKIVNTSSVAGWGIVSGGPSAPGNLVYANAKAGVIRLTRALAVELGGDNINVNCICPGVVYGAMWEWPGRAGRGAGGGGLGGRPEAGHDVRGGAGGQRWGEEVG